MNAQEMLKELSKPEVCEGLDEWIRTKLFAALKSSYNMSTIVYPSTLQWSQRSFVRAMTDLGYDVDVLCDDRPCAVPYYKVSIRMNDPRG
jgi:hypothetical protein